MKTPRTLLAALFLGIALISPDFSAFAGHPKGDRHGNDRPRKEQRQQTQKHNSKADKHRDAPRYADKAPKHNNSPKHDNPPRHDNGRHEGWYKPSNKPGKPGYSPRPAARQPHHPMPPAPPRPTVYVSAPPIQSILGLAFGSLIGYGVNQLANAGYQVAEAVDNAIYLSNVPYAGSYWPAATVYYDNGGLNKAHFYYGSDIYDRARYQTTYNELSRIYGPPVNVTHTQGGVMATWWGGNANGYITLSLLPSYDSFGRPTYYTDLIYGR